MVRNWDLSSGGGRHHSLDTVDVRLCCLNSGEVLAVAAEDEGLVLFAIIEDGKLDRCHTRCMSGSEVQLQSGITEFDRVAIFHNNVPGQLRHDPVTFGHGDARASYRLDRLYPADMIVMTMRHDHVLDVLWIHPKFLNGLDGVIREVVIQRVYHDQPAARLEHVRTDPVDSNVIQVVEHLERRHRMRVPLRVDGGRGDKYRGSQ